MDIIENCLLIIYHLMIDFGDDVVKFYIEECDILSLLYRMIETPMEINIYEKLLKIMTQINSYFAIKTDKKPVKKFLKFYITIL